MQVYSNTVQREFLLRSADELNNRFRITKNAISNSLDIEYITVDHLNMTSQKDLLTLFARPTVFRFSPYLPYLPL